MKIHEGDEENSDTNEDDEVESLRCLECEVNFTSKHYLHNHLIHHIRQPFVKLERVQQSNPPLKITLKNRSGNSFEIVSPVTSPVSSEPGWSSNSLDEVFKEEQEDTSAEDLGANSPKQEQKEVGEEIVKEECGEIKGECSEIKEEEEKEKETENPSENQSNEVQDNDNDPFEGLDGENSYPGSAQSHSTSNPPDDDDERCQVNFSPDLASVIGGAFLADINSPLSFGEASNHSQEQEQEQGEKAAADDSSSAKGAETADDSEKTGEENSGNTAGVDTITGGNHASPPYGSIPGAEPTPPPEPSPTGATEYPKIKIKTTGLFKDPERTGCTITEITDDNPNGDPSLNRYFPGSNHSAPIWTTPSLEDPLKLPDSDDNNLLNLFSNNDRAKDLGFSTSSDNEFISLDTYNERNRGTMQLYNSNNAVATSSQLESLTGLPMQALAQQVSRLQPSGNGQGLHQQNVLINIQQFPTQPQPPYPQQHQPMYPHYPPHPGQPPMHNYGYQPPSHVYYPPGPPGYPPQPPGPHMPPPPPQHMGQLQPPPQMGQQQQMGGHGQPQMGGPPGQQQQNSMVPSSQGQSMPPPNQMQQNPNNMQNSYRPPMPPNGRAPAPRGPQQGGPRMQGGPRGPQMNQRAPGSRPRAPMMRPRGAGGAPMRGQMRPRMSGPQNGVRPSNQTSPAKRVPDQNSPLQAKRKKLDILTPSDKDDDDCQVICMQPKNMDGGLPQIESVQGATTDGVESSIMHLSDSITLSVRNPPPKPVAAPVKSDAKAVANILATRGITVTAKAASQNGGGSPGGKQPPALPTALSLNGAVSIVASKNSPSKAADNLPTVDLTDDNPKEMNSPGKNRPGLPYRCDLCPAQYPNAMGLNKHRQTYHKTNSGMCELGVPLINIKQPGIMQKLTQIGINNYIPLPGAGADGMYALPIISTKNPGNMAALGATQMLSLGPVRAIPRPTNPGNAANVAKK